MDRYRYRMIQIQSDHDIDTQWSTNWNAVASDTMSQRRELDCCEFHRLYQIEIFTIHDLTLLGEGQFPVPIQFYEGNVVTTTLYCGNTWHQTRPNQIIRGFTIICQNNDEVRLLRSV